MCAGEVVGIAEMLNIRGEKLRACIPTGVTKAQLVRVVVQSIERNPAQVNEPFTELVAFAISGVAMPEIDGSGFI